LIFHYYSQVFRIQFREKSLLVCGCLFFLILTPVLSRAVTWNPKELACPLCQRKSQYYVLGSYGDYVRFRESRFELVEFPYDEELSLYACVHCGYTVFMGDFPKKLNQQLKKKLKSVVSDFESPGPVENYSRIPIVQRLEQAEQCYAAGVSCDCSPFWIWFFPIKAHFLAKYDQPKKARTIRLETLALVEAALLRAENQGIRKELLLDAGILKFLVNDRVGGVLMLNEALSMTYWHKELSAEDNEAYNRYLNEFINECIQKYSQNLK
jgi:hypothetical protein